MTTIPFNFGKEIKKMTIQPTDDNTTFIIADNSSKFARFIPPNWVQSLVIIAKIKGYDSIDDYVLNLIKDRLEMFADTRDELGNAFQEYMHNTMIGEDVPNEWAHNDAGDFIKSEKEDDNKEVLK